MSSITKDEYIEHEVQLRVLDATNTGIYKTLERIDKRFEHLEAKLDSQFKWTLGIMITMFVGLIIAKLV